MKVLTTNNKLIIATAFLAAFFSLALVAGAQDSTVSTSENTAIEVGESATIESSSELNTETSTNPPSAPSRQQVGREPRPEERALPAIQERQQERLEERENTLEERIDARASTTEQRQETRADNTEQRQTLRAERQTALQNVRQQRVLNLSANISNRMDSAIERIFTIITRIEQRIEKLKASGVDTAEAEVKLRESAQLLAEARATISDIDNIVYNATTSVEPKTAWQDVKAVYKETGALIRASHQALREVVALLKSAASEAELQTSAAVRTDNGASTSTTDTE